ncbi:MAG: MFS transporter [Planctomycetota bacterium]|nr:MFS transporter [Planctomycetota bacterium]
MDSEQSTGKGAVLLIAALSSFLTPFMGSALNVALPAIGREFQMSAVALTWVPMAYVLASAIFLVPLGRLADIHGRKRVFHTGIVMYTCASVCLAVAPSAPVLLIFRAVQGVGSAMIFCTGTAILLSVLPASERGRALGVNVAAVYFGLSAGPVLGGFLTQHFRWRSIFVFTCVLGAVTFVLALCKLKGEWAAARRERFDLPGAALYSLSLLALAAAFSWLPAADGFVALAAGIFGLAVFALFERAATGPLLDMNLFWHNTVFAFSNLAALINYGATFAVGFLLSLYLQHIKGLGPQDAGLVLLSQPVVMAVLSPLAGRLSDRVQPRLVASTGMGIITVGLVLLAFVTDVTPLWYIVACLVLLGLGFAFFSSPNTNAAMSSVERPAYGVASAILATMRLLGHVFSMGVVTLILSLFFGRAKMTPAIYPQFLASLRTAFPVFAALCLVGVFASLARGNLARSGAAQAAQG